MLTGFMGAGKSTVGQEVARRLGRPFYDVDCEIEETHGAISELFEREGESAFREVEARFVKEICSRRDLAVISVGGGAVETQGLLRGLDAFVVHLEVDVEIAWERVRGTERPLATDGAEFRRRYELRLPLYTQASDAAAEDADGVVSVAAGVKVMAGALELLGRYPPDEGRIALVTDPHVAGIHGAAVQLALGDRLESVHEVPAGEAAKTIDVAERLWGELRLRRDGVVVALGGGCVTDLAGFVAGTYLRGIPWVAVPTTLVGQIDAAIGGKTGINLPAGKNLVGVFHWPDRVAVDPTVLETLPAREWQEGMAELVKTGLLAGEPLWELEPPESVRRSAAFKAAVCLRDPHDQGERAMLNLGHTFAHALEAGAGYGNVTHGTAVALGLLAALRLSGRSTEVVERILEPKPVRADRERAWVALQRDKKRGLVLLGDDGPRWNVEVPDGDVRKALDELIAD